MFKRFSSFILIVTFLFLVSGCASLNGSVPFRYQPSLVSTTKKIDKTVGLNMLLDKRPEGDIAYTKSIKDIPEKVTSKLLEDFEKSKLFKEIHFPPQAGDDIVVNGTIDRFMWKLYATPISYIPVLNLVIYFGVPCNEAYGVAGITLEIKDNKTGSIIGRLEESSRVDSSYTLYNFKAGDAGSELEEAFRDVGKKLKEDLLTKVNF
jgi:hypothetical protein